MIRFDTCSDIYREVSYSCSCIHVSQNGRFVIRIAGRDSIHAALLDTLLFVCDTIRYRKILYQIPRDTRGHTGIK